MDTHITQNNKFAISLQYRKNEVSDEVDILCADKHESLMQFGTMILMRIAKYSQSSQKNKFAMSCNISKKKVRDEVDFVHADKYQSFLQVGFNTLGIKVSYKVMLSFLIGMIKDSQGTQSNNFAISLQYLKKN